MLMHEKPCLIPIFKDLQVDSKDLPDWVDAQGELSLHLAYMQSYRNSVPQLIHDFAQKVLHVKMLQKVLLVKMLPVTYSLLSSAG